MRPHSKPEVIIWIQPRLAWIPVPPLQQRLHPPPLETQERYVLLGSLRIVNQMVLTKNTIYFLTQDLVYEKWFEQAETAGMNLRKTIVMYEKKLDWYVCFIFNYFGLVLI